MYRSRIASFLVVALFSGAAGASENIDPQNDGSQYAYGENVGWLNTEPSGEGGPGIEVSDSGLAGWLWGENVGWISLSCANTVVQEWAGPTSPACETRVPVP